ncbi:reverse transcriptase domain-containing protein [Tanacetum coccineum]
MADNRTMAEMLQAPTEGYEDAIVVPAITADNFELKHSLLTLVQNKQFFGHDKEDPHAHIRYFNKITSTMKFPNVLSTSVKLMLFPFSLEGASQIWLEKEPPRSILTWDDLVLKFINQFFPPSKTTNLRNEITRFQQRFDESFYEAWDRFNDLLRACPHHGFSELHQLDTFYNALNSNDQDSLNSAAGVSTNSSTPAVSSDVAELKDMVRALILDKKNQTPAPAPVKAVEQSCLTCGGGHSYQNYPATDGNGYRDNIQEYVSQAAAVNYNQGNASYRPRMVANQIRPPGPTKKSSVKKDNLQLQKFNGDLFESHFRLRFRGTLYRYDMPKLAPMFRKLLNNKDKILELTKTPVNENCSAVILKKFPEKLGDPGRFLIPCDFPEMNECLALADLGASINLMPLSIWKELNLPDLTKTRMILELADRTISTPTGIAEDVFVKVGTFFFLADFVVVDYVADPRVPLILGRPFLRMARALIDVHGEQMTLRHDDQSVTFKVGDTKTFSYNIIESVNRVDVIDIACEEYVQEVLEIFESGNPTSPSDLMIDSRSPSFTPFGGSDFLMEEIDAFLEHDDSIPPGVDDIYDSEGDTFYIEELLSVINSDPNLPPLPVCEINVPEKIKSSCENPPDLELNRLLPSFLKYAISGGYDRFNPS